ncbi:MAG TPA: hypothetical protein IGS37_07850 [Synechococcales cyanobacterium M55_K2018_004]|nr:hypothetical protein [Synechococcales cyanobacterium M55_K2018_004]
MRQFWIGLMGTTVLSVWEIAGAIAQSPPAPLPACQPPDANELLVMVLDPTSSNQERLRQLLPANAATTVCDYLGTPVTRVGGFIRAEIANAWAQYLAEVGNFQTFVARPAPPAITPPTSPSPPTSPTSSPPSLGSGYAVLVPYTDQAETAAAVQRISGDRVGLVSYEQRSYLLAGYTADVAVAANLLKRLSDRNLPAMIVDGRRTVLLNPTVTP